MSRSNWGRWIADDARAAAVTGTPDDDRLRGGRAGEVFDMSQGGDDVVRARGGNDTIWFGAAFTGADRANGGAGYRDFVVLDGDYSAGVHVERDSLVKIEVLQLLGGPYVVDGELWFSDGSGTVVSAGGLAKGQFLHLDVASRDDLYVFSGAGDDVLHADRDGHDNYLSGGDGDDVLVGGGGATVFVGGRGADRIEMANAGDVVFEGEGEGARAFDTIVNFDGSGGRIRLAFDSDTSTKGIQHDFHVGETAEHTGDITSAFDAAAGETIVSVFTDADAAADFVVHLTGEVVLTDADFIYGA